MSRAIHFDIKLRKLFTDNLFSILPVLPTSINERYLKSKTTVMSYERVLPRDLFNESKLLKCLGRVCLIIHDGIAPDNLTFSFEEPARGFNIVLNPEGSLYVNNLAFFINKERHILKTTQNSKSEYPLFLELPDLSEIKVFNEANNFSTEFIDYCKNHK